MKIDLAAITLPSLRWINAKAIVQCFLKIPIDQSTGY